MPLNVTRRSEGGTGRGQRREERKEERNADRLKFTFTKRRKKALRSQRPVLRRALKVSCPQPPALFLTSNGLSIHRPSVTLPPLVTDAHGGD